MRPAALAFLLTPLLAQEPPAPLAETAHDEWSLAEAQALTWLQQRRLDLAHADGQLPREGVALRQYRVLFFQPDAGGRIEPATSLGPKARWFALAWPTTADATASRGLLLHADGTTLVCELPSGTTPDPSPDLAVAKGSSGAFADALRQPGTGEQGHLWLWLDQVSAHATVTVVDEGGLPLSGVSVSVLPADSRHPRAIATPLPLPVGTTTCDQGVGRLRGPRCGATVIVLEVGSDVVRPAGVRVASGRAGLTVTVPRTARVPQAIAGNESAAVATLKNIGSAQMQCQACAAIDVDADGKGEFGGFLELAGATAVRGSEDAGHKISPPLLSAAFGKVQDGVVQRSGYCFQVWLPGKDGVPLPADAPDAGTRIDAELAERHFLVLAWPLLRGKTGGDTFAVTAAGDVLRAIDPAAQWSGRELPPPPLALFPAGATGLHAQPFDPVRWQPVQ